jgi:hypothetical protein
MKTVLTTSYINAKWRLKGRNPYDWHEWQVI